MTVPEEALAIVHCCRDWPVWAWMSVGKCGFCGERPTATEKTVGEYMSEREKNDE